MQKIAQGAEAILYRDDNTLIKNRVKKSYRIAEIDNKLRIRRTRSDANLIRKAKTIIAAPQNSRRGQVRDKNGVH